MSMTQHKGLLGRTLTESWRREMQAARLYEQAAKMETDPKRRSLLKQLAAVEQTHAELWAAKMIQAGAQASLPDHLETANEDNLSNEQLLQRLDELEQSNAAWYSSLRHVLDDSEMLGIIDRIDEEEANHDSTVRALFAAPTHHITENLTRMLSVERWHKRESAGWLGDAIYGVNDGLGAIFGIIAGVAGYTANSHTVLVSGFFGAVASTLSMGVGAWLSTRSKNELAHSEQEHERREILEQPELEKEELNLLYQLKGFTQNEATEISERLAGEPEQFLKAMSQEELGIHEDNAGNPWSSAGIGSLSTFIGGVLPLIPFFFMAGTAAIIAAALVSIVAHFAVGAAKSIVTVRTWWSSGLEMTAAGIIVGIVSYGIGLLGTLLIHV
ncbi:MAG: VIT1/CCC1 transporter family protein [Firmicutes bacterium]|nr:VIT1/CCC1 transporter family protein [Bacillota bacterium]